MGWLSARRRAALAVVAGLVLAPAGVADGAPLEIYPTDVLTVADEQQVTKRRVNLPLPDCTAQPSSCDEIRLINQLDGFDLDPRIELRFGTPIDVAKATKDSVYIEPAAGGERIALNRLVWSPARNTLYGQPREQLAESTTYRIVVTEALSGTGGSATFTTLTASAGLSQMRRQLDDGSAYDAAGIAPADRGLRFVRSGGLRTVFSASNVRTIERFDDTGAKDLVASEALNTAREGAGLYAFGSFLSPSWIDDDRVIPAVPTATGQPRVLGKEEVGFALIVPSGTKPAGGWPVAIFGPGVTRSKYDLFLAADRNAARGVATIAIDPVGHAFGPRSEVAVTPVAPPTPIRFSGYGRAKDVNGDGKFGDREGLQARGQPAASAAIALRDGLRQTALDNMALVRAIGRGVDVDGDTTIDLRPTGVVYYAQSLGGIYGTLVMATDPQVKVGVLNVPGGPIFEIARLSPSFRADVATELKNRRPSVLNGGREGFTESQPLWIDPPVTAPAQGAVTIQEVSARSNWLNRSGSPEGLARLLRKAPLPDVGAKKVFYQFAFGDRTVPNPTSASIMRAGGLNDVTTLYRNDRTPTADTDPHGFLLDPRISGRNLGQSQLIEFLATNGASLIDPDAAAPVFEVPMADSTTLERLNFTLPRAVGEPPPETSDPATAATPRLPRLFLRVSPRSVRRGRRVRFAFVVTALRDGRRVPVPRVKILFARRHTRTNARGRAVLRVRLTGRPGKRTVRVGGLGYRSARATIRVRR